LVVAGRLAIGEGAEKLFGGAPPTARRGKGEGGALFATVGFWTGSAAWDGGLPENPVGFFPFFFSLSMLGPFLDCTHPLGRFFPYELTIGPAQVSTCM